MASGKRVHELELLNRLLIYQHGLMKLLANDLKEQYGIEMNKNQMISQIPQNMKIILRVTRA